MLRTRLGEISTDTISRLRRNTPICQWWKSLVNCRQMPTPAPETAIGEVSGCTQHYCQKHLTTVRRVCERWATLLGYPCAQHCKVWTLCRGCTMRPQQSRFSCFLLRPSVRSGDGIQGSVEAGGNLCRGRRAATTYPGARDSCKERSFQPSQTCDLLLISSRIVYGAILWDDASVVDEP